MRHHAEVVWREGRRSPAEPALTDEEFEYAYEYEYETEEELPKC